MEEFIPQQYLLFCYGKYILSRKMTNVDRSEFLHRGYDGYQSAAAIKCYIIIVAIFTDNSFSNITKFIFIAFRTRKIHEKN